MCPSKVHEGSERGWIVPIGGAEEKRHDPRILQRFVELCGGSDADIVAWDPVRRAIISARTQQQNADYNAYEGMEQIGAVRDVWLRGRRAVRDGVVQPGPLGEYLPRQPVKSGEEIGCFSLQ